MDGHWISALIALPLAGGLLTLLLPRGSEQLLRIVAGIVSLATLVIAWLVWRGFDASSAAIQFEEQAVWIRAIGASYHVGVDGMSLILVLMTAFLTPLAIFGASSVAERLREFLAFILVLESAMIGVFVSLDLLLFYVFFEAMLIPMAFLIGVWGGENRVYAAVKFFLYTMVGSVLMLVAILTMVETARGALGETTFDLLRLQSVAFTPGLERWLFLAFAVAFAIKVPLFPFHTWLPDAHVQAPTAGSVILAGVLLKIGTYGFLRFCLPLFPGASAEWAPVLIWLSLIGIIYGALMAYAQTDLKKLVAYSSVSHLGWVVLGLFALTQIGLEGALLQMVNHGINTGALFLLVGMVYERAHTREIAHFGGLARTMPVYATMMMIFTLASIGLPGTNGFVGEFSILIGAFQARPLYAILAAVGVVLGALYMLSMFRRIFYGAPSELSLGLRDIGARELAVLVPLAIMVVWIGVAPQSWLAPAKPTLEALQRDMQAKVEFQRTQLADATEPVLWREVEPAHASLHAAEEQP